MYVCPVTSLGRGCSPLTRPRLPIRKPRRRRRRWPVIPCVHQLTFTTSTDCQSQRAPLFARSSAPLEKPPYVLSLSGYRPCLAIAAAYLVELAQQRPAFHDPRCVLVPCLLSSSTSCGTWFIYAYLKLLVKIQERDPDDTLSSAGNWNIGSDLNASHDSKCWWSIQLWSALS